MDKKQILCLRCSRVLLSNNQDTIVTCECGKSYTYSKCRRSCNVANMPGGRATPIFESFILKWQDCKNVSQKMLLIDWLIHECHVTLMSGRQSRSVCVNFIEGTQNQIAVMLEQLASSDSGKV